MDKITKAKLEKYFSVSEEAYGMAKSNVNDKKKKLAEDFLDMISRYISDAKHFFEKGDYVNAFAALNYAHGWLDAGARSKIFDVHDSRLFTVDDKV
ncbi:DUF357 domain-containing protein [archaeon]|jgi:uncharacterized protein|nr:DUF357 domain-containing protein [archaeon]